MKGGCQILYRRVVVEGSAKVELPQGATEVDEGLGVDDSQLVVAQIQRANAEESVEGAGFQL